MERMLINAGLHAIDDVSAIIQAGDTAVRSLLLHGNQISSLHGRVSLQLPQLHTLNLSSNDLRYVDCGDLAACPQLETLDFAANRITGIRGLSTLHKLRSLNLSFNCLTDLAWISELSPTQTAQGVVVGASGIERLDLRDNAISDTAELFNLRHLPSLRDLRLQHAVVQPGYNTGQAPAGQPLVSATAANPVCALPSYVSSILASCPGLQSLDGVPVDTWRILLPHYEGGQAVMERGGGRGSGGAVVAARSDGEIEGAESVTTPNIDRAASRFLQRYLGAGQSHTLALAQLNTVAPAQPLPASPGQGDNAATIVGMVESHPPVPVDAGASVGETSARLCHLEAQLKALLEGEGRTEGVGGAGAGEGDRVREQGASNLADEGTGDRGGSVEDEPAPGRDTAHATALPPPPLLGRLARAKAEGLITSPSRTPDRSGSALPHSASSPSLSLELSTVRAQLAAMTAMQEVATADVEAWKARAERAETGNSASFSALQDSEAVLRGQVSALNAQLEAARTDLSVKPSQAVVDAWRERAAEAEAALAGAPSRDVLEALQARISDLSAQLSRAVVACEESALTATHQSARAEEAHAACIAVATERDAALSAAARACAELTASQEVLRRESEVHVRETSACRMAHEHLAAQASSALVRAREAEAAAAGAKALAEDAVHAKGRAEAELAVAKAEAERWQTRCADAIARGAVDAQTERERAVAAITAAEQRLVAARSAAEEEVHRTTTDANGRLQAARDALESHGARYSSLSKALGEARVELADTGRRLAAAQVELGDKDSRIAGLREELFRSERDRASAVSGAAAREQERAGALLSQVDASQEQVRQARDEAEKARLAQAAVANEVRVQQAMLADQTDTIRRLKRELAGTREQVEAAESGYRQAAAELRAQLEDARAALDGAEAGRDEAMAESGRSRAAAESAARVQAQLENVVQQVREEAGAAEELRRQLSAREAALTYVEGEIGGLKAAYEGKLAGVSGERDLARAQVVEARERCTAVAKEAEDMRGRLEASSASLAQVSKQLTAAEADGLDARARVAAVEEELRVVLRELDDARAGQEERARRFGMLVAAMAAEMAPVGPLPVDVGGGLGSNGSGRGASSTSLRPLVHNGVGMMSDLSVSTASIRAQGMRRVH